MEEVRTPTDEDLQKLLHGPALLRAHPATGWMSVEIIPGSKILREEKPAEIPKELKAILEASGQKLVPIEMTNGNENDEEKPGFVAARVVEVGPFPNMEFPWGSGDIVYIGSDRGLKIGAFTFVMVDKVLCYKRADEE